MKRSTVILSIILVVGAGLRLAGAFRAPVELIERDEFIPAAMTISLDHLPLRAGQHGAVPIYMIKICSLIFGTSLVGLRSFSVLAGTATLLLLYLVAARWWGPIAGVMAAGLLAIDRYHIAVSSRAIDLPYDLFFVTLAMFMFSRFLHAIDQHHDARAAGRWLYGTAIATALGFLCKELTAIMLPVFFVSLVVLRQTCWLARREPWIAVACFLIVIAPDMYSTLTITGARRVDLKERYEQSALQRGVDLPPIYHENGLYMSWGDQLSRFRSFGFNNTPFYFYFGDILNALGIVHDNTFNEFPFMHPALAIVLWLGLILSLAHRTDRLIVFTLTMFFVTFLPFTVVHLGAPRDRFPSDPNALWYWVDRSMLPAVLLTAAQLGRLMTVALARCADRSRKS